MKVLSDCFPTSFLVHDDAISDELLFNGTHRVDAGNSLRFPFCEGEVGLHLSSSKSYQLSITDSNEL